MRLVKAEINGFGRLAEDKVNLDHKVIAVVGPNEAGKSTLLKALAYIDDGSTLSVSERSRGMTVHDNATVVRVQYLLDEDDQKAVAHFNLEEVPRSIWLSRNAGTAGEPKVSVEPSPRKALAPLDIALKKFLAAATKKSLMQLDYIAPEPHEDGTSPEVDENRVQLRASAENVVDALKSEIESEEMAAVAQRHADSLRSLRDTLSTYELADSFRGALSEVIQWIDLEEPAGPVGEALYERSPDIVLFGDADRSLLSTYILSEELLQNVPNALSNLAKMAELDLPKLWSTFTSGDEGERETLIHRANQVLETKFAVAWKQSKIAVWLKIEGVTLAIRINQGGKLITQFGERSAGVKMFVALVAFLAVRNQQRPPVLLIDEAETHLHIDAQADLVNTFMTQEQAAKIIYTTHSPACLPPDLGSNIRAVVPDPKHEFRSIIQGSFWHGAAGFSPLMLAMGAGAAAFSAARFVVLGEGASEMLLLPSLVKSAIGETDLQYQVAPGLSEVPPDMYSELDLAGARVAYIVDGDKGGQDKKKGLIAGGVPEDQIVTLAAPTLENVLDPTAYLQAVKLLLVECNPGVDIPDLPSLPDAVSEVWPNFLDKWAEGHRLKMPGKRIVASRLVEENLAVPSEFGSPILQRAHDELWAVLSRSARVSKA